MRNAWIINRSTDLREHKPMKSCFKRIRPSKLLIAVCLALSMAASFTGCARKRSKTVIGFSQMENNGPWRIAETTSMTEEAKRRADKFDFRITDAQGQTSKQVADVEDLVAQGVSAIFLAPREFEGLAPALKAAREARIPVFLIDRAAAG